MFPTEFIYITKYSTEVEILFNVDQKMPVDFTLRTGLT